MPIWLRGTVVTASIAYLALLFILGLGEVDQIDLSHYVVATAIGITLYPASLISQAMAWALVTGFLRKSAVSVDWTDVRVYATSYLLRRLPGGVWQVAGRVASYRDLGVVSKTPITASVVELGLIVVTAATTYGCFGLFEGPGLVSRSLAALLITGVSGGCVGAFLVKRAHAQAGRGATTAAAISHAIMAELYLFALAVASIILFVYVRAAGGDHFSSINAVAVWALVAAAGTLAGLLPATMGLREVTLAAILVGYINRPAAVIIAVLFRLLFIAGDLLWGGLLAILARRLLVRESAAN